MDNADVQLMNMKQDLDKCRRPLDKTLLQIGLSCVVPYRVDGQNYRAQVIEINKTVVTSTSSTTTTSALNTSASNNQNASFNSSLIKVKEDKVKVLYIDYGNEDYVDASEVYRTTAELKNNPPLAHKCQLNLNRRIRSWLARMKDQDKEVMEELVRSFKSLTSKSVLSVKVIDGVKNIVDLFVGEVNICELLVESVVSSLKQAGVVERVREIKEEAEFSGVVVNYRLNLSRFGTEVRVVNELMLTMIEELSVGWTDFQSGGRCVDMDRVVQVAKMPGVLASCLQTKQKFGRVSTWTFVSRNVAGP